MIEIHQTKIGEVFIFTIAGRIDSINAPKLQQALCDTIEQEPEAPLLLRMAEVYYLSAAALRVLRVLKDKLGTLHIAEPSQRVREVMQITGLDATYRLYPTLTDALHHARPIVNAHTHLELGWLQGGLPGLDGADFTSWMYETVYQALHNLQPGWEQRFVAAAAEGVKQLIQAGVTTVGDVSSTGLSIQPLLKAGMRGIVYIELRGRDAAAADLRLQNVRAIIETWRPKLRHQLKLGLALQAPYSLHPDLWKNGLAYARAEQLPVCIHIAESPAELQYLKDGSGPLRDIVYPDAQPLTPLGQSPVEFLEAVGALALKPLLIHAVQVTDSDIALIKKYGCTVVHCPRSNLRLQCGRMPIEKFIEQGVPVLFGTDSLVSSPSLDIFDELEFATALHHDKVQPAQLIKMVHGVLPDEAP